MSSGLSLVFSDLNRKRYLRSWFVGNVGIESNHSARSGLGQVYQPGDEVVAVVLVPRCGFHLHFGECADDIVQLEMSGRPGSDAQMLPGGKRGLRFPRGGEVVEIPG